MKSAPLAIGIAMLAIVGIAFRQEKSATEAMATPPEAQCPMHPAVRGRAQDRCTLCGMNLVSGAMCGVMPPTAAAALVLLSPDSVRVAGVKTSEVKKQPLQRTLRISGMIGEDDSRHGIISAPVDGRVDGLSMNHEGQTVTQRQPLATIFSPTLLAAAKIYKDAFTAGGPPLEDAKRKLEHYGLVWEQIKTIPERQPNDLYFGMLSPRSGTIVKSYVAEGQTVKAGQKMFEVADFTKMWFHAMLPEQDVPFIKAGQIVKLRTASLPGVTLTSRIYSVSPNLDDMSRSARVRVILENPERKIKNNLFAEGTVEIEAEETLTVPRSAVLWPGNMPRVYVEKATGHFEPRTLKLGRIGDSDYEVLEGLKLGEHVVTSGNMLIDGQAQLMIHDSL
ncbi:MAG: efflux RND transporter periplasmic adaptor subunit [Prosthecobacter sp.]|uniref:efflux RND transporter periplasmic adaptor subunit n=1 Tax=Prosthecobacter sp. TaxID=1965333 RepID=UPI0039016431